MQQNLTVSALTKYLQYKFTQDPYLKNIRVKGEISNFKAHRTGHYYFSLKDKEAVIRCVIFNASKVIQSTYQPKDGDQVVIEGHVDIFIGQGSYQIYGKALELDGLGQLYEQYNLLKMQFEKKGYFDERHKKSLPQYPQTIALLTAKEGAAIQDMLSTLQRRYPLADIHIYPTLVQGAKAQSDIIKQLKYVQQIGADVIILGRGGGSIEDLWAFNEPQVIEEIFHCHIPIVSAVGHETDDTLADLVADKRAATPTAAAELVAPDRQYLIDYLQNKNKWLKSNIVYCLNKKQQQLGQGYRQLRSQILHDKTQYYYASVNSNRKDLQQKIHYQSVKYQHNLEKKILRLNHIDLLRKIVAKQEFLLFNKEKIKVNIEKITQQYQQNLLNMEQYLKALSPMAVMQRGYIIAKANNKVVTSVQQVDEKDLLTLYLHDGRLQVEIKNKHNGEKNG